MQDLILGNGEVDLIVLNRLQHLTNNLNEGPEWLQRRLDRGPDGGKRDINKECGYPETSGIGIDSLLEMYDRESIATRVVEVFPKESWKVQPSIYEDEDSTTNTPFEDAWDTLGKSLRGANSWFQDEEGNPVWEHLQRADKLSRIGSYGAILLGFNDGQPLNTPLPGFEGDFGATVETFFSAIGTDAQYNDVNMVQTRQRQQATQQQKQPVWSDKQLMFMRSYHQGLVQVVRYEANRANPRFGQPVMYRITLNDPRDQQTGIGLPLATLTVHWSRVIHVADNLGSSEIFGVPAMRPCYNQLLNLRKIYGGNAEMYWQAAMNILFLETNPNLGGDVTIDGAAVKDMANKIMNGMQRWGTLEGMHANQVGPAVASPIPHVDVAIDAIAALIGIPVRILMGSEMGELASSQDDSTWNDRLMHRQQNYITPRIIVPFVDRLIAVGVLPQPSGYSVNWPDLNVLGPLEQAQVATARAGAYASYLGAGADALVGPSDFLTYDIGHTDEEAESILENTQEHLESAVPDAEGDIIPGRQPQAPPQPGEPGSDEFDEHHEADIEQKKADAKATTMKAKQKPTTNFNPNHDQYGRFSAAATMASAKASKTGKAKDHRIASNAHTLAAAYAPDSIAENDHLTLANEHESKAGGSSPLGYKFKAKHLLYKGGALLDRFNIPKQIGDDPTWGRIANEEQVENYDSNEPRDKSGKWSKFISLSGKKGIDFAKSGKLKQDNDTYEEVSPKKYSGKPPQYGQPFEGVSEEAQYNTSLAIKATEGKFGHTFAAMAHYRAARSHTEALKIAPANKIDHHKRMVDYHTKMAKSHESKLTGNSVQVDNRDVSNEPRDDHGRWTLTGSFGNTMAKISSKFKPDTKTKRNRIKFKESVKKNFLGDDEYEGRRAQARTRRSSEFYKRNPEKLKEILGKEASRKQANKKAKVGAAGSFLGQVIGTATTEHIKATADDIVKASLSKAEKAARAKLDMRVRVIGTQGKHDKPFDQTFKSIESFNRIKDNNKIKVTTIEKIGEAPDEVAKTKLTKRVRQHLRGLAGQTIKAIKQHAPKTVEATVKDLVTKAITAVVLAKFTGNELTVNEDTHPIIVDLMNNVAEALYEPAVSIGSFGGGSLGTMENSDA